MTITDEMVEKGVTALPGWSVWGIKNQRMYDQNKDQLVREILEAALKEDS